MFVEVLPPKMKYFSFFIDLPQFFPPTLTCLHFSQYFNSSLEKLKNLTNLTTVTFGDFSGDLSFLPSSVKNLGFGLAFYAIYLTTLSKNTKLNRISFESEEATKIFLDIGSEISALKTITHIAVPGYFMDFDDNINENSIIFSPNITHLILHFDSSYTRACHCFSNILQKLGIFISPTMLPDKNTFVFECKTPKNNKSIFLGAYSFPFYSRFDWQNIFRLLKNGMYTTIN